MMVIQEIPELKPSKDTLIAHFLSVKALVRYIDQEPIRRYIDKHWRHKDQRQKDVEQIRQVLFDMLFPNHYELFSPLEIMKAVSVISRGVEEIGSTMSCVGDMTKQDLSVLVAEVLRRLPAAGAPPAVAPWRAPPPAVAPWGAPRPAECQPPKAPTYEGDKGILLPEREVEPFEAEVLGTQGRMLCVMRLRDAMVIKIDTLKKFEPGATIWVNATNGNRIKQTHVNGQHPILEHVSIITPYEKATISRAEARDPDAQFEAYTLYWKGSPTISPDKEKAVEWLRKAGQAKNPKALNIFGTHCLLGDCTFVPKEEVRAFKCYHLAAKLGDSQGQYNLGYCFLKGLGQSKDIDQAIHYLNQSAAQRNPEAALLLGKIYEEDQYGLKNLEQAAKSYQQAAEYYQQAVAQNSGKAQWALSKLYFQGKVPEPSMGKARELSLAAIRNGIEDAQKTQQEFEKTRLSAALGQVQGWYYLAKFFDHTNGCFFVFKDLKEAATLYQQAARKQGLAVGSNDWIAQGKAQLALSKCYYNGNGVEKDLDEAEKWLRFAEEHKAPRAEEERAKRLAAETTSSPLAGGGAASAPARTVIIRGGGSAASAPAPSAIAVGGGAASAPAPSAIAVGGGASARHIAPTGPGVAASAAIPADQEAEAEDVGLQAAIAASLAEPAKGDDSEMAAAIRASLETAPARADEDPQGGAA